jgi:hypothetical protein
MGKHSPHTMSQCRGIQEGGALIFAHLNAAIGGFGGAFVEAHELDARTGRKVQRKVIGRALTAHEAAALAEAWRWCPGRSTA